MINKITEKKFNEVMSENKKHYNDFKTVQDRKYHLYSIFRDYCLNKVNEGFKIVKYVGSNQVILYKNGKSVYNSETDKLNSETYMSFLKDILEVENGRK